MSKLIILDNAGDQLTFLKYFLEKKEYAVKILNLTRNLFSEIHNCKPDLLLLNTLIGDDRKELCNAADYISYTADDFIEKPFNLNALLDKIRSLLSWISEEEGFPENNLSFFWMVRRYSRLSL